MKMWGKIVRGIGELDCSERLKGIVQLKGIYRMKEVESHFAPRQNCLRENVHLRSFCRL